MEFEIVSDAPEWTDAPRELTAAETSTIRLLSRLEAIKRHREWTRSTLDAAIRCVDEARS